MSQFAADEFPMPEDFAAFWTDTAAEAMAAPLDAHRSLQNEDERPGFVVETLHFRGIDGSKRFGWFAYPPGARRLPAFLWVPPYGRESRLPDTYGTREGYASLSLNFHGEAPFHQERYLIERGYFAEGAEDPERWIFRRMFQDAVIAARLLQAQVEADAERVAAMGMSQGGGISIWLGAWCPVIRAVCADMPFLGRIGQTLSGSVYRYPMKEVTDFMDTLPLGRERVLNTVAYFDTTFHAAHCVKPTQVSLGLKDPATRPDTVRAIYDALPGRKRLKTYDWGHDWHPDMVSANREWLEETLRP